MKKNLSLYTDGGARGNPGPAALGVVLQDDSGHIIQEFGRYLGETTNNQAEYQALLAGLEAAATHGATEVHCYLDSELVVKQLKQEYRVKEKGLQSLFLRAWNLAQRFTKVTYTHIPREKNARADWLVNECLDNQASKK